MKTQAQLGRVSAPGFQETYPTGFATKHLYNAQGYLTELKNAANNASFWQATAADAHARLTQETYGNGLTSEHLYSHITNDLVAIRTTGLLGIAQDLSYTFDVLGNLLSRTDAVQTVTENFTYDGINRLTGVSGPSPKSYQYDAIGNITYKSDVGSYTYGTKPHAVTQAGPNTYTYDTNGNQISGAGRTITYTSFNKPSQIVTSTATVSFSYDAHQRRMRKVSSQSTTVYLGKLYEKTTQGTATDHKHYLYAANTLVGIYTNKSDNTTQTRYVHTDHLLSVDTITDEAGNVVSRQSYDAHGKRRNVNGTDATTPITSSVTRGFTRHEMDDDIGLINMNAREYDPVLGRFLTPDTFVQYPANTQGFNRYTYVNNNPLSYTDPSGHFLGSIFRAVASAVKGVVNAVKDVASSQVGRLAIAVVAYSYGVPAGLSSIANGAVGGGMIGFITAGDIKGAINGAITGAAFGWTGNTFTGPVEKVFAHAAVGGVTSSLQGGDFKSGFLSAGFAAGINPNFGGKIANGIARSVIGGVAAEIGGGRFANGATTATYAYLFNDLAHARASDPTAPHCGNGLCWPTDRMDVTDMHGTPRSAGVHDGVDIRARSGNNIYSTMDGIVENIDYSPRGGNQIYIRNSDSSLSIYSHTAPVGALTVSSPVTSGQLIGFSDGSPNVSPHLHYMYKPAGSVLTVDPLSTQLRPFSGQWRFCGNGAC